MLVRIGTTDLHRYTHPSNNRGWLIREMVNDGMPRREVVGTVTGSGALEYGAVRVGPREWQIVMLVWGRSYEEMEIARAELTALFAPAAGDLITIEARVNTSYAWRSIRAVCTGMEWRGDDERTFAQSVTISLYSPVPYWRYVAGDFGFIGSPLLGTNFWARLEISTGAITTTTVPTTALRRVDYSPSSGLSFVGSVSSTSVWQVNNAGSGSALGALPSAAGSIGGIALVDGVLVAGALNNITNPTFWWNGSTWIAHSTGMNGGVRRIGRVVDTSQWFVTGLFSAPRKLVCVYSGTTSPSLVTTYDDIFTDLTFSVGSVTCTDAYVEAGIIVAVARRTASPFVRWLRVGSLSGRTDIASWNENSDVNHLVSIDGHSLHDLVAAGTVTGVIVGSNNLQRAVRLRNLGGIEQVGDQPWGTQLIARRVGSRVFACTQNGAGDNWVLMLVGGGWAPVMWANHSIQDVAGDEDNLIAVGPFTQVQAATTITMPSALSNVAAAEMNFAPPTTGTFHGACWSDGEGSLVVTPSGLSFIPSQVYPPLEAQLGSDMWRLAQGRDRQNSATARQFLMLRNVVGTSMRWTAYVEDWRM